MEHIDKECKQHGLTSHYQYLSKGRIKQTCLKCNVQRVQKRRDDIKAMAVAHKGGKCENCGYSKYIGALDFHHKDPLQKDFSIGQKGYTRSWEKVKQEIEKCLLVCANCHREIHAGL